MSMSMFALVGRQIERETDYYYYYYYYYYYHYYQHYFCYYYFPRSRIEVARCESV